MNYRKFFFIGMLMVGTLTFVACGSGSSEAEPEDGTVVEQVDPEHNAKISLDYEGTYKGNLPCADCEAVETQLTLNADKTYMLTSKYLGKGDGQPFISNGTYTWKDGNTIELVGVTDGAFLYKVQENRLVQLDLEGNTIEGDLATKYILEKVN